MEIKMNLKVRTLFITTTCLFMGLFISTLTHAGVSNRVDFNEIYKFSELSNYAYNSNDEINSKYGSKVFVLNGLPKYDGSYFILKNEKTKTLTISIRGTANFKNFVVDSEFPKVRDSNLGIYLHDGFKKATDELYTNLKPLVEPYRETYEINITGHSLGAAMAAILMIYMEEDKFKLNKIITFGQPKVTNEAGAKKYENTSLLRIVDEEDVVPLLPVRTAVVGTTGHYEHFGTEVILLKNEFFVFLEEKKVEEIKDSSFWSNIFDERIKDHLMENYIKHIKLKLEKQTEVPYDSRLSYE